MRKILVRLSVVVFIFSVTAFAQKRAITEKDMFDFVWVSDAQISPELDEPGFFGGSHSHSLREPRSEDAILFLQEHHLPGEFLLRQRG